MKGETIWRKLLLFALFSSLVFGNPILKQNGSSDDVQVATVNGAEDGGSKGSGSERTEVSLVEAETTESPVPNDDLKANLVLDTNSTLILSPENPTQDENEIVTEVTVIDQEKYSEEVQISNGIKFEPTILEDILRNAGDNLTTDTILTNGTEFDSSSDETPVISDLADGDEIKTQEVSINANADALDVQPITEIPHHSEEEQIKGDTEVHGDNESLHIEDGIEVITEISTQDVTHIIEETTVQSLNNKEAGEEKLLTTLEPKDESHLSLLLKERLGKVPKETFSTASADQETSETVESLDSNIQAKEQTEEITAVDEHLENIVVAEVQNGDQSQRDTETTTHTSFEDILRDDDPEIITLTTIELHPQRDFETTTQNIPENGEEEVNINVETVDKNSVLIKQGDESEHSAKSSLYEDAETAESVKENAESEIINKLYRSEIEELKNKLITSVRLEGSSSNINENFEPAKEESTTETYEPTTILNLAEQYEETEATASPDPLGERELTTEASESQTERVDTPSQEERNKNKGSDYWLEMMGNRGNKLRNETLENDGKTFKDEETNLEGEESANYSLSPVENSTNVFIISDENETSAPLDIDLLVTTDRISEVTERTEISSTELSPEGNDYDKEEKDNLKEQPTTIEPLTEEIDLQAIEITTSPSLEVKLNTDEEDEITTQVTILTVTDLEQNKEEATTSLPSDQVIQKIISKEVLDSNLEEEDLGDTHVENKTTTESPISKTTESNEKQESGPEESKKNAITTENGNQHLAASSSTNRERISSKQEEENETPLVDVPLIIHTKPQRIEQRLSHLAEKFGKLGLRPILRRRAKHGLKRKRVDRFRYRKQLLKNF